MVFENSTFNPNILFCRLIFKLCFVKS